MICMWLARQDNKTHGDYLRIRHSSIENVKIYKLKDWSRINYVMNVNVYNNN